MPDLNHLIPYAIVGVLFYIGNLLLNKLKNTRTLNRWKKTAKDAVILHGLDRAYKVPTVSPFVLKVETYLRMANIPYKYDVKDTFGINGKTPWISLNGEHLSDSQLIVDFLGKKFDKNFSKNYSAEQLALGTAVRVMTEEHLSWSVSQWMFVYEGRHSVTSSMKFPTDLPPCFILPFMKWKSSKYAWGHGIGRNSEADVHKLMRKDLESISKLLGQKKFLLGDEPCEDDCSLFGLMAQFVWGGGIGSPESKIVLEELPNIKEYCVRMKEKFWPDWDSQLKK